MSLNFNNFIFIFVVLTVIVLGLLIYTLYWFFTTKSFPFFNTKSNSQLTLQKSLIAGAVVPYGNNEATTVVELTDAELNELLQIVYAEIGNSTTIEVQLLQSLGLYTDTVVSFLQALGFIIL
jgi:hypothetical protein